MQYDRFCEERIPHLFEQAKWQPLSDTNPNYRYDQTAKDLRFLINTLSMSFDQVILSNFFFFSSLLFFSQ